MFIMLYYVLLYWVQRFFVDHLGKVLTLVAVVSLLVYIFWFPYKHETSSKGLYGITTFYRWIPYFGFMLIGAWVGMKSKIPSNKVKCRWYDVVLLMLSVLVFYGIQFMAKKNVAFAALQILSVDSPHKNC